MHLLGRVRERRCEAPGAAPLLGWIVGSLRVDKQVGAGLQRVQEQHVSHWRCTCSAACVKGDAAHPVRPPRLHLIDEGDKNFQPQR